MVTFARLPDVEWSGELELELELPRGCAGAVKPEEQGRSVTMRAAVTGKTARLARCSALHHLEASEGGHGCSDGRQGAKGCRGNQTCTRYGSEGAMGRCCRTPQA